MEELIQYGPTLEIILNALLILGTGAGLTWWITQRIEERIQRSTEQMNRLQSIEMNMVGMAKQKDLARLQKNMATKEDLATAMAALKAELLEAINRRNGNGDGDDDDDDGNK